MDSHVIDNTCLGLLPQNVSYFNVMSWQLPTCLNITGTLK